MYNVCIPILTFVVTHEVHKCVIKMSAYRLTDVLLIYPCILSLILE